MFFKKSPPPINEPYSLEKDARMDDFEMLIDLSALDGKVISIERENIDSSKEHTSVYVVYDGGSIENTEFSISRKQHKDLVEKYKQKISDAAK